MKKNFIYLLLLCSLIAQAQVTPSYPTIKLTKTVEGVKQDSLLVVGTDKTVKHIPASKLGTVKSVTGIDGVTVANGTTNPIIGISSISQLKVVGLVTDLSNKVDKVTGKSLIADSEITRLATVTNQDISGKANDADVIHLTGNEVKSGILTLSDGLKLPNNTTSTTATKVNVQENDGTINTKPLSELVNYLEFASAVNLPVTGEQGKLYLTKDNNRLYRFNGTFYQELTTDISGKEDIANKQNSLAVDGTNTKYPTVTAVNTGLALKANLASPALTGTPTAPTATAGTNTTQIATTAFVTGANNGNVKLTGDQTISGQKIFSLTGKIDMQTNNAFPAIIATTLGSNGGSAATFINSSSSPYSTALLLQTSLSGGVGNRALDVSNQSPIGTGIVSNASNGGVSISSQSGNGDSYISNITSGGTGRNYVGRNNGTETYSVDKIGNVIGNSFIKSSTPTTNILLAGGSDIAQNTAFNKNFGITAGTVVEGGTLGSNAYSSTNIFPISGSFGGNVNSIENIATKLFASSNALDNYGSFLSFGQSGYTTQINSVSTANGGTYIRVNGDGSYGSWRRLWHDGDFNPANYLPLSGGTLSGAISGTSATFSGTVTAASYTATSLPVFENNAAASSLAVGQFYRTSTGVLMVKF